MDGNSDIVDDVPNFATLKAQCIGLGTKIHDVVHSYNGPRRHAWLDEAGAPRLGTMIQKVVMTQPEYMNIVPDFVFLYQHRVLKISGEAVIESMCKVVAKHAARNRGISFQKYGTESIISWSAPTLQEADLFLTECLNRHFTVKLRQRTSKPQAMPRAFARMLHHIMTLLIIMLIFRALFLMLITNNILSDHLSLFIMCLKYKRFLQGCGFSGWMLFHEQRLQ